MYFDIRYCFRASSCECIHKEISKLLVQEKGTVLPNFQIVTAEVPSISRPCTPCSQPWTSCQCNNYFDSQTISFVIKFVNYIICRTCTPFWASNIHIKSLMKSLQPFPFRQIGCGNNDNVKSSFISPPQCISAQWRIRRQRTIEPERRISPKMVHLTTVHSFHHNNQFYINDQFQQNDPFYSHDQFTLASNLPK